MIVNKQLLKTKISVDSSKVDLNIEETIRVILKENLEGKCYEDGYIIKDTLQLIERKLGKLVSNNGISKVLYEIMYKADIISPSVGDEIEIIVSNINKMGVVGYYKLDDDYNKDNSPIIIMIPSEYFNDSIYNINDINVGQRFNIKIIGSRIKYQSDKIQVIAKPSS